MTAPQVSVVVPCLNEARYIGSLLEALSKQDFSDFEIIVLDSGSTDGSQEIVRRHIASAPSLPILLLGSSRRTIPSALNLGIRNSRGEIIARLDAHSLPAPDYLRRCLAVLSESGAEVVGGAWEIRPGGAGARADAVALAVSSPLGAGDALYRLNLARGTCDTDTVPFGCFRRKTWEAVGGYNENLLANEDYEFNFRVRRHGGRVHFDPSICCEYFARSTLVELARQYWRYGWWKGRMLRKYPRSLRLRQAVPVIWTLASGLLLAGGWMQPFAWVFLAVLWTGYLILVAGYSVWLATQSRRRWTLWPALAAA